MPLTNLVFPVRTESYGSSFSHAFIYGLSAKRAKSTGKKRGSVTYCTDRENEVSQYIYYISEVNRARGKEN